ncbi:hypothetical protein EDC56_3406 [Sinobacterium caligoides]|uniref:Uncharacterized protein n=1 Tax=Sinobacterium caligoides TaxID=933926 RepID=A0A3N2DFU4_9GAMM|nr:hypothetical protein [Sinobacterium caligoides]ROR98673.1 hypothetical protein EDC56_3406 [Sinobacterium caligoides]
MSVFNRFNVYILSVMLIALAGCSSAPLQRYAKSGDILTIPFASIKKDTNGERINAEDLTVTISSAASSVPLPVTVLSTRRVFDAPSSTLNHLAREVSDIPVYDGQWFALLELSDPSSGEGLALPAGPAVISITSPKLLAFDGNDQYKMDPQQLPIEIIEGAATALPDSVLTQMQIMQFSLPELMIRPDGLVGDESLGGVNIVLKYTPTDSAEFLYEGATIVMNKLIPDSNTQLMVEYSEAEGSYFANVILLNRHGFVAGLDEATATSKGVTISASDMKNITLLGTYNTGMDIATEVELVADDSYYFDREGHRVDNVTPVLSWSP